MDLEEEGEGRRHGGRVLCGSGGNMKGGMRKMTAGEWANIRLRRAKACGMTQPCHVIRCIAHVLAWQLGHAKACGVTLQGVTPRNLA